jgi:hypothetical protein
MSSRRRAARHHQRLARQRKRTPQPALITARTAATFSSCGSLTASATPTGRAPKIVANRPPRWWPGPTGKGALTATAHPVPEVLAGKDESLPDIAAQLAARDAKWKRLHAEGLTYAKIGAADGYSASTVHHVVQGRGAPKKKPLTTKIGRISGTGLISQTDSPPFVVVSFTTASDKAGISDRLNLADAEAEAAACEAGVVNGEPVLRVVRRVLIVDTRVSGSHRNDPISAGIDGMIAALHAEATRGQAERRRAAQRDEDGTDEIADRAILDVGTCGPRGGGRPAYASKRWPNPEDNPWLNLDWDVQVKKLKRLLAELYEGASTRVKEPV